MDLTFASPRVESTCASLRALDQLLGAAGARAAVAHLASLRAAASLDDLDRLPGRCRHLSADGRGALALDLPAGWTLVFEPTTNPAPTNSDGHLDWRAVHTIRILEITDHHRPATTQRSP
jgi:hypothetical protein